MRFPSFRSTFILAKLSIVPVRRGFWGNKLGKPHTVPTKVNDEEFKKSFNSIFAMMTKQSYTQLASRPFQGKGADEPLTLTKIAIITKQELNKCI